MLSTFQWFGPVSGDFNNPSNWLDQNNNPGVPGPGDDAVISFSGITVTSLVSNSVHSLASNANFMVSGGTFTVSTNSSLNQLTLGSGTIFQVGGGTATVGSTTSSGTFDTGAGATLAFSGGGMLQTGTSFTGAGLVAVTGGDLTAAAPLTAPTTFELDGGQLDGTGDLTVTGIFSWNGGSLSGTGSTVIAAGGQMVFAGGNHTYAGRPIDNTAGPVNWVGGTLSGSPWTNVGLLNITRGVFLEGITLNNAGTVVWSGVAGLVMDNASVVNNLAGATFHIENVQVTSVGTVGGFGSNTQIGVAFNNAGTFVEEAGSLFTPVQVPFNNTGTVEVLSGRLNMLTNASNTGTLDVEASGDLAIAGGTFGLESGTTFTGPGLVEINGGALSVDTPVSAPQNLALDGGTLTGAATLTLTNQFGWSSGALAGTGTLVVAAGTQMVMGSGNLNYAGRPIDYTAAPVTWFGGTLTGSPWTNVGQMNITGFVFLQADSLNNVGVLNVSNFVGLQAATINNAGTVVWSGLAGLGMNNGSVFNNLAGSVFDVQVTQLTSVGTLPGIGSNTQTGVAFNNAGMFRRSVGTLPLPVQVPFINTGTVEVDTGEVDLAGGGSNTGTLQTSPFGALAFSGGTYHLGLGTSISGTGALRITGASLSVDTALTAPQSLELDSGTLTGGGALTVTNRFDWTGGALAGTGSLLIAPGGQLLLEGGDHTYAGRPIDNTAGPVNWVGGSLSGSPWTNVGLLNITRGVFLEGITLNNAGTVVWSGVAGLVMDNASVVNNLAGATFHIENVQVTSVGTVGGFGSNTQTGVAFNNAGTFVEEAGSLFTPVQVPFNNTGTVELLSGTLDLIGPFGNFSGSTLTGGTYLINSTLEFGGANIISNAANIILDGSAAQIIDASGNNALANFTVNAAGGSFTVRNHSGLVVSSLSNAGSLTLGSPMTATGGFTQTATGSLTIEIAGPPGSGQFGQISTSGTVTLDGALNVHLTNGFGPTAGESFQILSFASMTGNFTTVTGLSRNPLNQGVFERDLLSRLF